MDYYGPGHEECARMTRVFVRFARATVEKQNFIRKHLADDVDHHIDHLSILTIQPFLYNNSVGSSLSTSTMTANFQAYEASSIVSRRNFGLIRGKSLQNALNLLHVLNSDEEVARGGEQYSTNMSITSDMQISPPYSGARRKAKPTFGQGGFGDKSCNIWDWPLGPVTILNTDNSFRASLSFVPFKSSEISAKIMGNELIIQCSTDDSYPGRHREFYRTYQLPLNLETSSVRFTVLKDSSRLVISADKHMPLKLAIFSPDDSTRNHKIR